MQNERRANAEARPAGRSNPAGRGSEHLSRDRPHRCQPYPTDAELVVLEGFHAIKHAIRCEGEIRSMDRGPGCGGELGRAARPGVLIPVEVVNIQALKEVAPRGQVVAVARRPVQPDPGTVRAGPGHVVLLEDRRHLGNLAQ